MSSKLSGWIGRLLIGASYAQSARPTLSPRLVFTDTLAGLTVSLALVPEAIAFAFVAGVAPLGGCMQPLLSGW